MTAPPLLTLLTDFGRRDYYVAALKGVVLGLAPRATIVDLTHEIAPGDVEEAAFVLSAAAPAFPPTTLHLAVVDPGVGSTRAMLALANAVGTFLAPDNGLLSYELARDATRSVAVAVAVDREDLYRSTPGATFAGRDRFAPVAAAILNQVALRELGPRLEQPVRLDLQDPRRADGVLEGRVAHVDRFGNLVTDIPASWLTSAVTRVDVGARSTAAGATHYAAMEPGRPTWMIGSLGTVELALQDAPLAAVWNVRRGETVRVRLG